ncbi:MAG: ComEC/Rec2 family competence protein [Actinomycetota bacterium]|nr:ComEC/Rec2 family competence protein [Actinomycetota bacterium]
MPKAGGAALARVWLAAAGLSAGVVWGFEHPAPVVGGGLCTLGGLLLCLRRKAAAGVVGIIMVASGAGALDASLHARPTAAAAIAASLPRCTIGGSVLEDDGALGTLVTVTQAVCSGFAPVHNAGTVMFPQRVGDLGATISATGTLLPLQDDAFDVSRRRAGASAWFDPEAVRSQGTTSLPLKVAASIRQGIENATRSLGPPRGALVRGLTIGDTTDIDQVTVEDFRRAGLSHLLAVSGENLAMFLGALAVVFRALPYRLRLLAYLAAIALFVLIVGPQPSVLRAAVMGAVMVAAVGAGRRVHPLHVLATALIVVIAFRPGMVFSVGLQLSAAATAGIVLWTRPVQRSLRRLPRFLALPLAVTVSAQAAVAPILIGTFGQLSLVSPLANLMAFPAVAPPTVLGFVRGLSRPSMLRSPEP